MQENLDVDEVIHFRLNWADLLYTWYRLGVCPQTAIVAEVKYSFMFLKHFSVQYDLALL